MLNLIKSDLYRITRPRGLRGSFWQYGVAILAVQGIVMALVLVPNSAMYHEMTGNTIGNVVDKVSLTAYFADMLSGIVPLCVAFMAVEHALAEFKNGYIKSVLSARTGRLSYIAGKLVFVGVLSALIVAFATAIALVFLPIMTAGQPGFTVTDGPVEVLGWFAGFWLDTWALAACSLVLVYATRVSPVSYIGAFFLSASVVPQALVSLACSAHGMLRFLEPFAPALETLAAWMPSTALGKLGSGSQLFVSAPADIWGETSRALTIDPGAQVVLTGIIWIVVSGAIVLAISRKRDI